MDYSCTMRYTGSMAKRDKTLGIHPKSNKSHKTKKRLEIKKTMLAARATAKKPAAKKKVK